MTAEPSAPRGFVRIYVDLYPEQSDRLNELARARGNSKKALIHTIINAYLEQETTGGKGKNKTR